MKYKSRYSIGDMSRICNISKKALRYYDKIGLITSYRNDANNYRFYTVDSLLTAPVIKYYKQMGFTLDEMRDFIEGKTSNVYRTIKNSFRAKIDELERAQETIRRKHVAIKDWYNLVVEAQMVIDSNVREVSVRYVTPVDYIYQEQMFDNDLKAAIINIEWTNYLESIENEITGPVILNFHSFRDRLEGKEQKIRIMQQALLPCEKTEPQMRFGGCMMATRYHIGPHENIGEAYAKIGAWARERDYELGRQSFERYVTDYWTTNNSSQFVTEVMIEFFRKGSAQASHECVTTNTL